MDQPRLQYRADHRHCARGQLIRRHPAKRMGLDLREQSGSRLGHLDWELSPVSR